MSDVMAKIQAAEKKAEEVIASATEKASSILSDAQLSARKASEKIKEEVLTKNASALASLTADLEKKEIASQKEVEKKVADLKKSAEKKIPALVKKLVTSIA